jgi:methyl-accepting chemotaxis protein
MKFDDAVSAHVKWRWRLKEFVGGRGEQLTSAAVGRADQCELGKWIAGEGRHHATNPEFVAAQRTHAAFHRCAAEVVRAAETGDKHRAEAMLAPRGAFEKASMDTISALRHLQRVIKGF